MARRKASPEIKPVEANVLPILNVMFLLIPALLLAMEAASLAAVTVSPPKFSPDPGNPSPAGEPSLGLRVTITEDGFRISASDQQLGAAAGISKDSTKPSIPLANPGTPLSDFSRYDYLALEAKAKEIKTAHPREITVSLSAEPQIPMQVLVTVMEAMRGSDCQIGAALASGEEIPNDCLFWRPVIEAGAG